MTIPQERLERYKGFVELNSTNGIYDHNKGLEALLSTLTPDPKVMVLGAMAANKNHWFFSPTELQSAVLEELENNGVRRNTYPITAKASWQYCERADKYGNKIDGSLVDIGAVVKHTDIQTQEGPKTGYQISIAGLELAIPIDLSAIEFVWQAGHSKIPHQYDSMWRILGGIQSKSNQRRQLVVYHIVKFLVENSGYHRLTDIEEASKHQIHHSVLSQTINLLSQSVLIEYQSPTRDINGVSASGWVNYALSENYKPFVSLLNPNLVYKKIQNRRLGFYEKDYLQKILEFIKNKPSIQYESNELSDKLSIGKSDVSRVLSALADIGVLFRIKDFKGRELMSKAKANDLTKMFYDIGMI